MSNSWSTKNRFCWCENEIDKKLWNIQSLKFLCIRCLTDIRSDFSDILEVAFWRKVDLSNQLGEHISHENVLLKQWKKDPYPVSPFHFNVSSSSLIGLGHLSVNDESLKYKDHIDYWQHVSPTTKIRCLLLKSFFLESLDLIKEVRISRINLQNDINDLSPSLLSVSLSQEMIMTLDRFVALNVMTAMVSSPKIHSCKQT